MELLKPYFYTATIKDWHPVIADNNFQSIILDSLKYLSQKKCIEVYAFVIMPNHLHMIWQQLEMNRKETPVSSFMKFTAHEFQKRLRQKNPKELKSYEVTWLSRNYNFWLPDSHSFELYSEKLWLQKIDYIHNNPLQEHWKLALCPEEYLFSSAKFYYTGGKENDFGFLVHYMDREQY